MILKTLFLKLASSLHRLRGAVEVVKDSEFNVPSTRYCVQDALAQLVKLSEEHGAEYLILDFTHELALFRFLDRDGREGKGEILHTIKEAMLTYLNSVYGSSFTSLVNETLKLYCERLESNVYKISRQIPRALEPVERLKISSSKVQSINKKPSIIMLDDQQVYAQLFQRRCQKVGLSLQLCQRAQDALDILLSDSSKIQALICDVNMPEMSGIEVVRTLRDKGIKLPIIMLSSDSEVSTQEQALESGADVYFAKHEDPELLLAYVKRVSQQTEV